MPDHGNKSLELYEILRVRVGARITELRLPPPSFTSMQAEFVEFNAEKNQLTIRFPLLESYLNPFNYVQGGFLAAAVDNTLGPLSVLVAPANLTRRLEMTYSHPVTLEVGSISVIGRLVRQEGRQLHFAADVLDGQGNRLARARAWHWII